MKLGARMARPLAWAMIVVASLFIALGILNLIINTDQPGSYLPAAGALPIQLGGRDREPETVTPLVQRRTSDLAA